MTELNELFEQIFHCERNLKERTDQLKALDASIQECQLKWEQTEKELHSKQGKLAVKDSKLADVEMEVKLMQLRKEILQNQKDELINSANNISEELDTAETDSTLKRRSFLDQLRKFNHCYGLHEQGLRYREEETKKQIDVLQDELILMETEMIEVESCLEDVKNLEQELKEAKTGLGQGRDRQEDLKTRQLEQEVRIQQMKVEMDKSREISDDSDLKYLQSELDSCKNSQEEETCRKLKRELEELQKECYHKQMRLQVARHNKKTNCLRTQNRGGKRKPPNSPAIKYHLRNSHEDWSDEFNEPGGVNQIDDDEWLAMESHAGDDDDDGGSSEEGGWDDIDETELEILEQNLIQTSQSDVYEDYSKRDDPYNQYQTEMPRWSKNNSTSLPRKSPPGVFTSHRQIHTDSRLANKTPSVSDFTTASSLPLTSGKGNTTREEYGGRNGFPSLAQFKKSSYSALKENIDSPDSSLVPRKRQGESILKAHGYSDHQALSNSTKKVKRVQFHY